MKLKSFLGSKWVSVVLGKSLILWVCGLLAWSHAAYSSQVRREVTDLTIKGSPGAVQFSNETGQPLPLQWMMLKFKLPGAEGLEITGGSPWLDWRVDDDTFPDSSEYVVVNESTLPGGVLGPNQSFSIEFTVGPPVESKQVSNVAAIPTDIVLFEIDPIYEHVDLPVTFLERSSRRIK